tara:strand:- start:753 stop:1532 length:780 start_codon:yes stop_codon:yes gene_type:complete
MFILKRYYKFYKSNGLTKSILKIVSSPWRIIYKIIYNNNKKKIFESISTKKRFELIHQTNFWSSNESVSGLGSEHKNTINIKKEIINIINYYKVKSILDAPCGDFNWIKDILNDDLNYLGGDIVKNLIHENLQKSKKKNITFKELDITSDTLPNVDLMLCRDCLIHLSYKKINLFFQNFKKSNIKFLLLTSYKLKDQQIKIINSDIPDGEFREIDMSEPPFLLPEPVKKILDKDEQTKTSAYYCYLNLYTKEQIDNLII